MRRAKVLLITAALFTFPAFADTPDIAKLTAAAKDGDAIAQYNLGEAYLNGNGVEKDGDQAARWLRKSAQQAYVPAEFQFGALYVKVEGNPDSGVLEDPLMADKWLRRAAESGSGDAMRTLGLMYLHGVAGPAGNDKNETTAFMWLELSAAAKNPQGTEFRNNLIKTAAPDSVTNGRNQAEAWKRDHAKLFL